jgi:geranylgeranyl diphosphate synthase type I
MSAASSFSSIREEIDAALAKTVRELIVSVQKNTKVEYVSDGAEYLEKLVLAGGKRVRGYCAYQMYLAAGGEDVQVGQKLAVSLELFHLFALIHDDIMDQASSRRGVTTIHHFSEEWLRLHGRVGNLQRTAESQAMLWGDFLLAVSQAKLQEIKLAPEVKQQVNAVFSRMFTEVVLGQMIDVDMTTRQEVSTDELWEKTLMKSTLYTFVRPLQLGVAAAGGSEALMQFAENYGTALGTAFQLQDDLFDVTQTEATFQKPVLNDIQEGAHTILTSYIMSDGTDEQKLLLKQYMGTKLTEKEQEIVRDLYYHSGAVAKAESEISHYFAEAEASVVSLPENQRQPWLELLEVVRGRSK